MFEDINDLVDQYKQEFEAEMENRKKEREQEAEIANLGRKVAARGFRKVVKQVAPDIDLEKIDEENRKLSEQVWKRVEKIDSKLQKMPSAATLRRTRHNQMMQQVAMPHRHSGFLVPPPVVIIGTPDGPTDGTNRCEVTSNTDLSRIYPVSTVRGVDRDTWRDSEVVCDYLWFFTTDRTELHYVTPHIEFHGRRVFSVEHHCFHDANANSEIQVLMEVNQDRWITPSDVVSSFSPWLELQKFRRNNA